MARIPRHFHFIFGLKPQDEPFHIAYFLCLESCLQVNRPERITFYYHHEPYGAWWDLIRDRLELVHVSLSPHVTAGFYDSKFIRQYNYAHHADFIRLEKLCEYGGVYADIDTLFVNPLPDALFEESFVLGREKSLSQGDGRPEAAALCNAFIMAEPNAAFLRRWIDEMPAAFDGSWSEHSCQLPNRLSERYPQEISIEPERSFYPYMWTEKDLRELLQERHHNWEGAYSLHLWSHLWWSARRFDFSPFNGDRITERFIRRGTTTYALAARRFLPPAKTKSALGHLRDYLMDLAHTCWARRYELKAFLRSRSR
jgi:hypothetical protein